LSITLTTPYTVSIGGVSVEDDTIGACTSMSMDYLGLLMNYTFKVGTLTGSPANLNVGPYAQLQGQTISVNVYVGPNITGGLQTGNWYLNGVLQSSIISGTILSPIITQLIANRNTAEGFVAVSGGLLPGSVTNWTQL
jgi:hypothetical protein